MYLKIKKYYNTMYQGHSIKKTLMPYLPQLREHSTTFIVRAAESNSDYNTHNRMSENINHHNNLQ